MRPGVRSKLFLLSVALIISGIAIGGLVLESELRSYLEVRTQNELVRQAGAVRETMSLARAPLTVEAMDPLADRMGAALGERVTVLDPQGRVIGDSALTPDALRRLGPPGAHRLALLAALAQVQATAGRTQGTLDPSEQLYSAVSFVHPRGRGVVRVARPMSQVVAAQFRLRNLVVLASLIGLVIAVLMSGLASHQLSRPLRELARSARAVASGARIRIEVQSGDEIGGLAGSVNRLADDIAATMSALAMERARFAAVLEGMTEAVIGLDAERRITVMNRPALALLGLDEASAPLAQPFIEHLRAPAINELLAEPIEPATCELELPGKPVRRVLARVSPQRAAGCVIVMHDVTSIRRLETVRRDFVANVSHELRTPVCIIRANAETLLDGAMDDPVHGARILEALHRNADRLARIVEDLLDLSRLEAGRYKIARTAIDVSRAAQAAIASVAESAADKDIQLGCEVPEGLSVKADDNALDQILVNFLDNAIKYTPAGGSVRARARQVGERIRIEIVDDGPGIAPRHRERIFERFYRVDPGRSRDMGGTGLGLSIIKHLADALGGDAGMDPALPHGACFWVSLPRA